METINASDWDRSPHREILVWLLAGENCLTGDLEDTLMDIDAAALAEYRTPNADEYKPGLTEPGRSWIVHPTLPGQALAISLAHSGELLVMLQLYTRMASLDAHWTGVPPFDLVRELDRRDGGLGHVTDATQWLVARGWQHVQALPRRHGLDGEGSGVADASA